MVYECDQCKSALSAGSLNCPKCGEQFENAVPPDAEVPRSGFTPVASHTPPEPITHIPQSAISPTPKLVLSKPSLIHNPFLIIVSLLFCFPVGLVFVWTNPLWSQKIRVVVTGGWVACVLLYLALIGSIANNSSSQTQPQAKGISAATYIESTKPVNKAAQAKATALAKQNSNRAAAQAKRQAAEQAHQQQMAEAQQRREAEQEQRQEAEANAEANYRTQIVHNSAQLSDCLTTFSSLCGDPKFYDDDWKIEMAASLIQMKQFSQEGQAIRSPKRFRAVQSQYSAALREYEYVSDEMPAAIDHMDADKMRECVARMDHATELISNTKDEIDKANNN